MESSRRVLPSWPGSSSTTCTRPPAMVRGSLDSPVAGFLHRQDCVNSAPTKPRLLSPNNQAGLSPSPWLSKPMAQTPTLPRRCGSSLPASLSSSQAGVPGAILADPPTGNSRAVNSRPGIPDFIMPSQATSVSVPGFLSHRSLGATTSNKPEGNTSAMHPRIQLDAALPADRSPDSLRGLVSDLLFG